MTHTNHRRTALSSVAALALALTGTVVFATPAAAAPPVVNYADLVTAINDANSNPDLTIITLGADITLQNHLPEITESLEMIGGGNTIYGATFRAFYIEDSLISDHIDFSLSNATINGADRGLYYESAGDLRLDTVTFDNSRARVSPSNITATVNVIDSTFMHSRTYGLEAEGLGTSLTIKNSSAHDNDNNGFDIGGYTTVSIEDTSANNNDASGFSIVTDNDTVNISRTTADNNSEFGFSTQAQYDSTITADHLQGTGNGDGGLQARSVIGSHTTVTDSVFNDTGDGYGVNLNPDGGASSVTIERVTVKRSLGGHGGVLINDATDVLSYATMTDCTIEDNEGTGIFVDSTRAVAVVVDRTTVSGSTPVGASNGGGIGGTLTRMSSMTITSSTISGNSSTAGGGISLTTAAGEDGRLTISHSTIADNTTVNGVGDFGGVWVDMEHFSISHSIVAGNLSNGAPRDLFVSPQAIQDWAVDYSLVQAPAAGEATTVVDAGASNIKNQAALLAPLANNGPYTRTRLLLSGSPAINAGNPAIVGAPTFDQRAQNRFVGVIDMGSVEMALPAAGTGSGSSALAPTGVDVTVSGLGGVLILGLGAVILFARRRQLAR